MSVYTAYYTATYTDMVAVLINYCTNPSFETDLAGWDALSGTEIEQDSTWSLYGSEAMLVTTAGYVIGEGFTGPVATNDAISDGILDQLGNPILDQAGDVLVDQDTGYTTGVISMSFLSSGSGTLIFEAVDAYSMEVLGSTTVTLDGNTAWDQRVQVEFGLGPGQAYQLMVTTPSVQALSFWVDGCQYETGVTEASQYIDGDQPGCEWLGTPELSDSGLIYPNATGASGPVYLDGRATPVDVGSAVYTSASGSMTLSGDCAPDNNVVPVAAFTDFAIFGLTDPDPAQTFADDNNAGVDTGSGAYAQSYGIFYPPLDYPVSNGAYAWRRAAYMDVGFYFTGVPALNQEILNDIEVSLIPIGNTTPLEYTPPRQIATIIKPTRLNFCTNPAFAVDTTGWTGTGTGTIATDSTVIPTPAYDTVAQAGNLAAYFNSTGIIQDGSTGMGNFDGSTWSYSAQALAAAGLGVGAPFTSGGIGYVMPSTPPGSADNIQCLGQTISIAGVPGASVLGFAGASAGGAGTGTSGNVTITYTDGTTTVQSLGLSDWTLGSGADPVNYGNQVAGSMTYRDNSVGASANTAVYVFTATVPVNGAKTVASITLPNSEYMHIFGMSLAATSSQVYTTNSGKVTVNASGDGVEIAVPDLIVGDVYTVSFQVQAGAALASITAECGDAVPGIEGSGSDTITGVAGANLETAVWFGMSFSFVATYSTSSLLLKIAATGGSGVSYPTDFWVNSFLIETGEVVLPYFDGSFGSSDYLDYQWESGGTAGKARSYYYEQFQVKQYTVQQVLQQHIPLGLSAPPPEYLTVYTQ